MEAVADVGRNLLDASTVAAEAGGSDTAPFFGFIGAASALVFACALLLRSFPAAIAARVTSFQYRRWFCRLWRSVRDRKVRRRYRVNGCPPTRAGDEVDRARYYGGCAGHLRSDHCGDCLYGKYVPPSHHDQHEAGCSSLPVSRVAVISMENICLTFASFCPIACAVNPTGYTLFMGYAHLSAGLSCGLGSLAAGMCIGIVGDAGVRYASICAAWYESGALVFARLPNGQVVVQGERSAAPSVCRNAAYPHFRRSACSLRTHWCAS